MRVLKVGVLGLGVPAGGLYSPGGGTKEDVNVEDVDVVDGVDGVAVVVVGGYPYAGVVVGEGVEVGVGIVEVGVGVGIVEVVGVEVGIVELLLLVESVQYNAILDERAQ